MLPESYGSHVHQDRTVARDSSPFLDQPKGAVAPNQQSAGAAAWNQRSEAVTIGRFGWVPGAVVQLAVIIGGFQNS
jgi:hypothetical protein